MEKYVQNIYLDKTDPVLQYWLISNASLLKYMLIKLNNGGQAYISQSYQSKCRFYGLIVN